MPETLMATRRRTGDPTYAPFIVTPCFPSYPSNHGSGSGGAAEVLRRLYGEAGHLITLSNPAVPSIVLQYTRFGQILNDISNARVYGGIHFRTYQDAGATLGTAIGTTVFKTICVRYTITTKCLGNPLPRLCGRPWSGFQPGIGSAIQ